jgi:hypothetical protein
VLLDELEQARKANYDREYTMAQLRVQIKGTTWCFDMEKARKYVGS